MPDRSDELLTIEQTATRLGYTSRPPVYRLLRRGELPSLKVGHLRRIRASDVDAFLDARAAVPYAETVA